MTTEFILNYHGFIVVKHLNYFYAHNNYNNKSFYSLSLGKVLDNIYKFMIVNSDDLDERKGVYMTKFTLIRRFVGFDIYQGPEGFIAIDSHTTKRFEGKTLNSIMTDIDEFLSYDDSPYSPEDSTDDNDY